MTTPGGILHHIRHAEQWLRRARSDYERGDARAAVLRLLLAEAEVRRARESGTQMALAVPASGWRRHVPAAAVGALAAAAVLALTGYAVFHPPAPSPAASAPQILHAVPAAAGREGIVQLESGRLLSLMGLPPGGWPGPEGGMSLAGSWGADDLRGRSLDDLALPAGDPEQALPSSR